jgi:hypothetical protein
VCAIQQSLPHPFGGGGVLGAVNNKFSLHSDKLSLGCFPAPRPGEWVPAGVCLCAPLSGCSPLPFECVFWMGGWERGYRRPLFCSSLLNLSLPYASSVKLAFFSPLLQLSTIYLPILTETSFPYSIFPHTKTDDAIMVVFFNLRPVNHGFLLTTLLEPRICIVFFYFCLMWINYIKNVMLLIPFVYCEWHRVKNDKR